MINNLKPYDEYKDSKLPWLGGIPARWMIRRNGRLFAQRNETGFSNLPILEVSLKTGVRVRDFDNSTRKQVMADREKYKRARQGDIAYNMMRMWQGAVGVAPVDGLISPAYVVARPLPEIGSRYYEYLFRTGAYMNEVNRFSRGIVSDRNRLYWEDFKQMPSPFPPPEEQAAIVRFLDHADRRIRRYIRAKRKLIALLNEQKQAIIHRAVTRGLDPNICLKPSGVAWLGDVPEHWEVTTLGRLTKTFKTGPFGSILHQSDYVTGGTPVINPVHMKCGSIVPDSECIVGLDVAARLRDYELSEGDIIFSRRGELGRCALVRNSESGWLCGTGSIRARLLPDAVDKEFLITALQAGRVGKYLSFMSVGATMESLSTGILKALPLALPPRSEQQAIADFIRIESRKIERAIGCIEQETRFVQEYRTRLIADAVTGKLDVRQAAARLPDEADEADELESVEEEFLDADEAVEDVDLPGEPEEVEA